MDNLSLTTVAALAEIVGVITIVSGIVFGFFQLRAHRVQQRNVVAMSLAQTFYNTEFSRAVLLLHELPDGVDIAAVREAGPEYERAAVVVCTSFETMGLLVYRRIADFELVMDLAGGMAASMFRKLENWIEWKREAQGQPSWAEWFEWLAKLSEKYKDEHVLSSSGVANWKP